MAEYKAADSSTKMLMLNVNHPVSLMQTDGSKAAHSPNAQS